jgi:hypothetical protein
MAGMGAKPKVRLLRSSKIGEPLNSSGLVGLAKLSHRPRAERRLAEDSETRD